MNTAKRLRRSPEGGYARGDETRHRIIEAAVDLFGEHGFEGASTRDIAARAGVNAPALQYYFENKEGVYRACVEALADDAWKTFGPVVEHAQKVLHENREGQSRIRNLRRAGPFGILFSFEYLERQGKQFRFASVRGFTFVAVRSSGCETASLWRVAPRAVFCSIRIGQHYAGITHRFRRDRIRA